MRAIHTLNFRWTAPLIRGGHVALLFIALCLMGASALAQEVSPQPDAKAKVKAAAQATEQGETEEGSEEGPEGGPEGVKPSQERLSPLGPIREVRRVKPKSRKPAKVKPSVKRKKRRYPTNRPKRALKPAPSLGKIPFPLGERLAYKVNLLNAHSGTVTLKVGQRGSYQGKKVVELSGFIQSSPFLENFYPIRDSLSVLVDEVTFHPLKSQFFLRENNRDITFISEYDPQTKLIDWKQKRVSKGKTYTRKAQHMPPVHIYESLSSLYALRRIALKPGLNFEQYVWDGKRERLIEVKVLGEERVLTDMGWFETYKVELSSVITGGIVTKLLLQQAPVKGTAWIAKDAYHTPVKLITPTRLGEAEAVLVQRSVESPQ